VSKKKSYMDMDNILSEGVWEVLLHTIVPQSLVKKYKQKSDAKIKKLEKEIEFLAKQQDDAQERMFKALEKRTGKKIKRQSAKDTIADYYKKRRK
jgi:acetyl-CoA carboxylase alpha subunit